MFRQQVECSGDLQRRNNLLVGLPIIRVGFQLIYNVVRELPELHLGAYGKTVMALQVSSSILSTDPVLTS